MNEFQVNAPIQDKHQIAIVGMGCYFPGANDLLSLWENILAKRQQFRRTLDIRLPSAEYFDADPAVPDKTYAERASVLDGFDFDWVKRRIPKSAFESTDIVHWLALETAYKALQDAGYERETIPTERTGIVLGNTLTGEQTRSTTVRLRWPYVRRSLRTAAAAKGMSEQAIEELVRVMEDVYKSAFAPITEDSLAGGLSNTIAGRVCNYFNFQGGGYTVDGACASSLIAIATAANALISRDLDIALAGGVDVSLDAFELIGFAKVGALTPHDMTVYDRRASGFIPGEGSGCVVMKRLEDARRDGNYIYALLNGWAVSSDGKGGITAPSKGGQSKALLRAYAKAGYSSHQLDFIEGHGTGTPVGDRTEIEGIVLTLAADGEIAPRKVGLTSFKSLVGHTKAAAGVGGFIKAVMAVNQRILPPTCGCHDPNPLFNSIAQGIYPILQGEIRGSNETLTAGVSAMGFGGINCHVTLSSGDAPSDRLKSSLGEHALLVSHQTTELFVFSAPSFLDLQYQVANIARDVADISVAEMTDLAAQLSHHVNPTDPIKAAIVAESPKHLLAQLERLAALSEQGRCSPGQVITSRDEISAPTLWISHQVNRDRVAFLFPGQGSQQLNMARVLVERHSWATALLHSADQWLVEIGCEPLSRHLYKSLEKAAHSDEIDAWKQNLMRADVAPAAICFASILWFQYLQRLGITPVAVGGHSLGELSAFYAAGAYDYKTLLQFAAFRGKATTSSTPQSGSMVSLGCDRTTAEQLIQSVSGYVVVANINHPTQTVISGDIPSLEQVLTLAQQKEISGRRLSVANAFHSAYVQNASEAIRQQAPIPKRLAHTDIPIISGMTGQPVAAGIQLQDYFADQLTTQVDFISLVQTLAPLCDHLIEVGTGQVLSRLVQANQSVTLCLPVEAKAGNDSSLNTILGHYFVHGGSIQWDELYKNRLVREYVSPSQRIFIGNPCENPLTIPKTEPFASLISTPLQDLEAQEKSPIALETLSNSNESELVNLLTDYFSTRGDFLAEIIHADMKSFPTPPIHHSAP